MLVLGRKVGQSVVIDGKTTVTVLSVNGSYIHLGFEAAKEIPIHRKEILDEQEKTIHPANS
jgi:carbon storage regulator